jgi:hypothetical protein
MVVRGKREVTTGKRGAHGAAVLKQTVDNPFKRGQFAWRRRLKNGQLRRLQA